MPTLFRTLRLRRHADYGLVYNASRKHHSKSFSFFYRVKDAAVEGAVATRFGITVPRMLGPAVIRNRIKRRVRVVARAMVTLLPPGADVVLHPRPEVATMSFAALEAELEAAFRTIAQRVSTGAVNTPLPQKPRGGKRHATKPRSA